MLWRIPLVLAAVALVSAQQQRPAGRGINFYSKEREAALGAGLAKEMRRGTHAIEDPAVGGYIDRLARQLARQMPDANQTWSLAVVSDDLGGPTHEPVALPGGYIFIPAGLVLEALDEAEVAGMLAHAMAHISERHGTRVATRDQPVNTASMPLIFMSGWSGGEAVPLGFLQAQRAFELEADRFAVGSMAGAGFDPTALTRYIIRTQPEDTGQRQTLSRLPARTERVGNLKAAIAEIPHAVYSSSPEFTSVQETLRSIRPVQKRRIPSLRN